MSEEMRSGMKEIPWKEWSPHLWHPIATAPKDGTWVLLWFNEGPDRVVPGVWEKKRVRKAQNLTTIHDAHWWHLGLLRMSFYLDLGDHKKEDPAPSYWMPLPEPPEQVVNAVKEMAR